MGEFTDITTKKAKKLNSLVDEMRKMDNFRDSAKSIKLNKKGYIKAIVCTPNGSELAVLNINTLDNLTDNVTGLIEVAINKRYEEIREILDKEFGGAYTEVKTND